MNNVGAAFEVTVSTKQARDTPINYEALEALLLSAERHLTTGMVFLSRHVLFDEGTFPFAHFELTSLRQGVLSDSGTNSTLSFNFPITKPDLVYPEPIAAPNDLVPSPSPHITHPIPSQPPSSSPLSQDRGQRHFNIFCSNPRVSCDA
ncbi:unnamed protein product [Prunus brigantina]